MVKLKIPDNTKAEKEVAAVVRAKPAAKGRKALAGAVAPEATPKHTDTTR